MQSKSEYLMLENKTL